jgi:hypothetical protein
MEEIKANGGVDNSNYRIAPSSSLSFGEGLG